jgi:3-carboxy-cis,cis-muconate cycloisomerase
MTEPEPGTNSGLLGALDGDPVVDAAVGDDALLAAMLDTEVALSRAAATAGLVPGEAAEAVAAAAAGFAVPPGELGRLAIDSGNPVIPLVQMLADAIPAGADHALHIGATSQDILDTALALVAHRALGPLLSHLSEAAGAAAGLARDYRDTPMLARTLGQPAAPTTFGLRAAGWLTGLDGAMHRLTHVRGNTLAVQLGGAAGTRAGFGGLGADVAAAVAAGLGLADPGAPWFTERSRIHRLAAELGSTVASCAKIAADMVLMSQAEIAEAAEGSPGGSSAMPHKRNPIQSILVLAAARRAPALVASIYGSGAHEQERAAGSWHAEWQPQRELLRLAGGAASRTASILRGLQVDPAAMRRNLDAACPAVLSESLAALLRPALGREAAQRAVQHALQVAPQGGPELVAALRSDPRVAAATTAAELAAALDPAGQTGDAAEIVALTLAEHDATDGPAPHC